MHLVPQRSIYRRERGGHVPEDNYLYTDEEELMFPSSATQSGTKGRKTAILIALVVAVLSIPVIVHAFGTSPSMALGNTGAPGQGTCHSCHGTLTVGSGVIVTAPTTYTPGSTTPVSMTVSIPTSGGFQLAVLTQTGNAQAGTLSAGSQDVETTLNGIQYISSAMETTMWTFSWTPPATNVGNVVLYVTGGRDTANYSNSYTIAAPAAGFTLTASPASVMVSSGQTTTENITIHPQNGFNGTVAFTATGLPSGVTPSFGPASSAGVVPMTLTASSTAPATTTPSTVTVTGTSGTLSPQTTTFTLTVSTPVSATLSATPLTLPFAYQIGGTAPASKPITVTTTGTVNYSVATSTTSGGPWLAATPTSGSSSGTVAVSVTPTGLAAGTYNGTVTITASGATGSPQIVQVTLTVTQAGTSSLTVNPSSLNFNYPSGGGGDDASEG